MWEEGSSTHTHSGSRFGTLQISRMEGLFGSYSSPLTLEIHLNPPRNMYASKGLNGSIWIYMDLYANCIKKCRTATNM